MLSILALLQLVASTGDGDDAYQNRITPEVLVVESAGPAVVTILTNEVVTSRNLFGHLIQHQQQGAGSGVVIYEDGFIVTNNHVVAGAERIEVQFDPRYDSRRYPARLVSAHPREDLALLKIDGDRPFPTLPPGRSDDLLIGERVVAIGNPYGQSHTVSAGIISGLHRNVHVAGLEFDDLIQTDASINPGNSGGPLLNINGELIGINTAMNTAAENIGFAIPVDHVREVLQDYLLSPDVAPTWLGFEADLDGGARVARVVPGGPADRAGVLVGDRILTIAGRDVSTEENYRIARVSLEPDSPAVVEVLREGERHELELRGLDRAGGLVFEQTGLQVKPVVLGFRRPFHTVEVVSVQEGSPADRLGIRSGDILNYLRPRGHLQPHQVRDADELAVLLQRLGDDQPVDIELWRDENGNGRLERTGRYSELFTGTLHHRHATGE